MLESMLRLVGGGYSDNEFCLFLYLERKRVKEYLRADARSPQNLVKMIQLVMRKWLSSFASFMIACSFLFSGGWCSVY